MYAPPKTLTDLITEYADHLGSPDRARVLIYVEMTLYVATQLNLSYEPLTVGWALLSRIPVAHLLLDKLLPEQRRMWANAAQLIPLSSRVVWQQALAQYAQAEFPADTRMYTLPSLERMDTTPIAECRAAATYEHGLREQAYEAILTGVLPFERRVRRQAQDGTTYRVGVKTADGLRFGRVRVTDALKPQPAPPHWFSEQRPRTVLHLRLSDLLPTAKYLDHLDEQRGKKARWVKDLCGIRLRRTVIEAGRITGLLAEETVAAGDGLPLAGMVHLPGMVSAGKTTLAKLIIAHCLLNKLDVRITFVVGDSQTAIATAHQINRWFHDDPAGDAVSAVPLLGVSQRDVHWQRLTASSEYKACIEAGEPHWGERWLMPVCPIAPQIQWEGAGDVSIPLGSEPCERFMTEPRRQRGSRTSRRERCLCPLISICPAKQLYRDMPVARVWITTPGALAQARLPLHWDDRTAHLGELVYEQSDLVILDEVETIVDWFDKAYACTEALTNGSTGLLDQLDPQIAHFWLTNRLLTAQQRRWVLAVRESVKALTGVLSAIADPEQTREVKNWVSKGTFSANQLAYRLARRLAGLKEWDESSLPAASKHAHDQQTNAAFAPFRTLLNSPIDPLRRTPSDPTNAAAALAAIMQAINNLADNVADNAIFTQCKAWVTTHYPDIETRLTALKQQLEHSDFEADHTYARQMLDRSADDLARRLQFLLLVALLDRHLHIVIGEWHNKPETLDMPQPFSRIPRSMQHILPLPLTGQQYVFVIPKTRNHRDDSNRLSLFAYTNIGRSYLLNFHHLFHDFDGLPGPHVLALSGTSYLPDSTLFHVDVPPVGILMPTPRVEQALDSSLFTWHPFYRKQRPIAVSGRPNKLKPLQQLTRALLDHGGRTGGFLATVLEEIERKAQDPQTGHLWTDRARLLLLTNSYEQSEAVAIALRDGWREAAGTIYDLKRGKWKEDYEVEFPQQGRLQRMDIEGFAQTSGRVLVAPMQSIGRGFNILNQHGCAAFGAVLFLIRPMNAPHDKEAIAQELNRLALTWAADPGFGAWQHDTLYQRAKAARSAAETAQRLIEGRRGYKDLQEDTALGMYPRRDLAATTAGRVIQAVGRLLRGGVPFSAYFIDAAWSPVFAKSGNVTEIEPAETSLLTAMIDILREYTGTPIGAALYGGLSDVLGATMHRDSN